MESSKSTKYRKRKAEVATILNGVNTDNSTCNNNSINSSNLGNQIYNNTQHSIPTISPEMVNSEFDLDEFCQPDSDDEFEKEEDKFSKSLEFKNRLTNWGLNHNITHVAMKELLSILKNEKCGINLPSDPRTLFKTPKSSSTITLGTGKFKYFGIRKAFEIANNRGWENASANKSMSIGIDGLPISKSSKSQFWPILALFKHCRSPSPYVIALYFGTSKPASLELFLQDFIVEMLDIKTNGIIINDNTFTLNMKCLIADAPARSFLKMCNGFNAYYGCERCCQKGKWVGKVVFPEINAEKRTNESFFDNAHTSGRSPFADIGLGMISQVPLDYMHLVCLGIMRKLIFSWLRSPLQKRIKLSPSSINQISGHLKNISFFTPSEFCRKPRCIREIDHYKATELRQFLIYTGPVCLKNVLPSTLFDHFMLLHCSMRILLSNLANSVEWIELARKLLVEFVSKVSSLYGEDYLTYNMHSIIHIPDDALIYGELDNVSAFPFENHMQTLKKLLRAKHLPLEQAINRIEERNLFDSADCAKLKLKKLKIFAGKQFSTKKGNNIAFLSSGEIVEIECFIDDNKFIGKRYLKKCDAYTFPLSSHKLKSFVVSNLNAISGEFECNSIIDKGYLMLCNDEYVCMPLL